MSVQCKCGSRAINDDPDKELCDTCWRDAEIERLRGELDECRRLPREAVRDPERVEIDGVRCREVVVTDEWMHAAQASGGGDGE